MFAKCSRLCLRYVDYDGNTAEEGMQLESVTRKKKRKWQMI